MNPRHIMSNLKEFIISNQDDIEWEYYPDHNQDFPISERRLDDMTIGELIECEEVIKSIIAAEEERYKLENTNHGRSE